MAHLLRSAQRIGRASPLVAWLVLTLGLGWSGNALWRRLHAPDDEHAPANASVARFVCPMHPNYHSDAPGDCPVCNMDMVPRAGDPHSAPACVPEHAVVRLEPARRQLIGVRTQCVEERACTRALRLPARVEVDPARRTTVALKTGGWVEELFVRSEGARVAAGQPLFTLYSPELFEAQRKYIVASSLLSQTRAASGGEQEALKRQQVDAARARLALWDLTADQVRALEQPGAEPLSVTPIVARADGVVLRLDVAQGARVEPGEPVFELADLGRVWVVAQLYQNDLARVAEGLRATVALDALPGRVLVGQVDYVYPTLDERTRTARVRIALDNAEGALQPGMYATATIELDLGPQIAVDAQAVLDTGLRRIVFVELAPGEFEPREVVVGERFDGQALIASGLEPNERVVTSGTFLIDSESRMQAALELLEEGASAP